MVEKSQTSNTWDYYPHIWKTESAYLTWLRGQIRRIWNTCPQKVECLKKNLKRLPKYDTKGNPLTYKNGKVKLYNAYQCELCSKICYQSDKVGNKSTYAVDHKDVSASLTKFEHVPVFLDSILRVRPEDLQILCTDCHDIKTYAEKEDIPFKEALFQKIAIKHKNEKTDKQFFIDRGLEIPKNQELRREKIVEILKQEMK